MPRCEGLPTGHCPKKVNNRTVKNSICDLFLCPSCEATRFPPRPQAASSVEKCATNGNNKHSAADTHKVSAAAVTVATATSLPDCCAACHEAIEQLCTANCDILQTVAKLREEIQQLRRVWILQTVSSWATCLLASAPFRLYCWVTCGSPQWTDREGTTQAKCSCYGNEGARGRGRRRCFCELCETCLPVKPSVIRERCRRLGRRVSEKTRPLLVTLANERSAAELLQCAQLLRNSENATGIYINADRTKAEALAAFQERERRRAKRAAARSSTLASADVQEKDARNPNTNLQAQDTTCAPPSGTSDRYILVIPRVILFSLEVRRNN